MRGSVVRAPTCDIVRSCRARLLVELAPRVEVDELRSSETRKALIVDRACVPVVAGRRLVADPDRVTTVEKAVLAGRSRTPARSTDAEARAFAEALARERARPAFPDGFHKAMPPLQQRIRDECARRSSEGRLLAALREIRVHASPSWDAAQVDVRLLFIEEDDPEGREDQCDIQVEAWYELVEPNGRFKIGDPIVGRLEDFTARDYFESDRLDLDWLSAGR